MHHVIHFTHYIAYGHPHLASNYPNKSAFTLLSALNRVCGWCWTQGRCLGKRKKNNSLHFQISFVQNDLIPWVTGIKWDSFSPKHNISDRTADGHTWHWCCDSSWKFLISLMYGNLRSNCTDAWKGMESIWPEQRLSLPALSDSWHLFVC